MDGVIAMWTNPPKFISLFMTVFHRLACLAPIAPIYLFSKWTNQSAYWIWIYTSKQLTIGLTPLGCSDKSTIPDYPHISLVLNAAVAHSSGLSSYDAICGRHYFFKVDFLTIWSERVSSPGYNTVQFNLTSEDNKGKTTYAKS